MKVMLGKTRRWCSPDTPAHGIGSAVPRRRVTVPVGASQWLSWRASLWENYLEATSNVTSRLTLKSLAGLVRYSAEVKWNDTLILAGGIKTNCSYKYRHFCKLKVKGFYKNKTQSSIHSTQNHKGTALAKARLRAKLISGLAPTSGSTSCLSPDITIQLRLPPLHV